MSLNESERNTLVALYIDKADYKMFIAEAKDVLPHVENVKTLIKTIEDYVK